MSSQRDFELDYLLDAKYNITAYVDNYKFELPVSKNLSKYYVDQSPYAIKIHGFFSGTCYTPYGISVIESRYINYIQHIENYPVDASTLGKMIRHDPHLHNVIKSDLLNNLRKLHKVDMVGD